MHAKNNPPKKPSTVFFGDTLGNSFCLPKFFPTKKAKVSLTQTNINEPNSNNGVNVWLKLAMQTKNTKPLDK